MADIHTTNIPILQQPKSNIITNPLIIPKEDPEEINDMNENNDISDMTLSQINQNVSSSFLGLCQDILQKPKEERWNNYIFIIIQKDNRYKFLLILVFFIFIFYIIVKAFES